MRFVVRESLTRNFLARPPEAPNNERLSALYFDYKSLTKGASIRLGRQSPNGGGVLYRFDGAQAAYAFAPKWKVNGVVGRPTDDLADAKRLFYGLSVDADALTKELSGSAFLIQQTIDGETDRRAVGADLRYFKGGVSASSQLDYDVLFKKVNTMSVQGNWQVNDATSFNALLDRRAAPILTLGNLLFFRDPNAIAIPQRITDLLAVTPIETLHEQAASYVAYQNQFRVGATRVLTANWQTGADFSLSSVDEIKPIPILLPDGQKATGNQWSVNAQMIGSNLYSARDTHVFNLGLSGSPDYRSTALSYNNLTALGEKWEAQPSLRYVTTTNTDTSWTKTWTLGVRGIFRVRNQISLESEFTYDKGTNLSAPSVDTNTGLPLPPKSGALSRLSYSLGARVDF
jgi:hypothetical protein